MNRPACPDCTARLDPRRQITHDESCPVGVGVDRATDGDRRWFADHPDVDVRRRPVEPAEITELKLAGIIPGCAKVTGDVVVRRTGPGVRTRQFHQLRILVPRGAA